MNDRKQQVIEKAHQLFIEKGFQATSIQDILDFSGISKGTFYNYFPSKSELIKDVFVSIHNKNEKERNELLIGENLADMEIFIKQMDFLMQSNKRNKMFSLFEEVIVSNDPDLKQFIKQIQYQHMNWMLHRFLDLFGEEKKPYLLDCTVIFFGMLQQMVHYHVMAKQSNYKDSEIIRYCVERIKNIVADVSMSKAMLLEPELLKMLLPKSKDNDIDFQNEFFQSVSELKKIVAKVFSREKERLKYFQLLDFIQEELMNNKLPRIYLIESSLLSLLVCPQLKQTEELERFNELLTEHLFEDEKL